MAGFLDWPGMDWVNNPYANALEEKPQMGFLGFSSQLARPQRRFFDNRFSDVHNQYLANLSQQVLQGGSPQGKFTDFLRGYDWSGEYGKATPQEKGSNLGRLSPSLRWL